MRTKLLALALGTALAGVGLACDGGEADSVTLEEYFSMLQSFVEEYEEVGQAVEREIYALSSPAADWEYAQEVLGDMLDLLRVSIEAFEETEPPDEVARTHATYVQAMQGTADFLAELAEVKSEAEAEQLYVEREAGLIENTRRGLNACWDLEEIAAENDLFLDLKCASSGP